MADPFSSIGSVIGTSATVLQLINRIRQQYAGSELYMAQATAECSTVRLALVELRDLLESRYTLGASSETRDDVLASGEAVTVACAMSLSMLEKYVTTSVKAFPETEEEESSRNLGKRQKLKIAWNHDEIGHHLQQLRGCQSSLTLLLGVLQCRSTTKMCSLLAETRATLERVHLAIQDAGFDGVSLSGMTVQIEEAFEFVQPGNMSSDRSGLSQQDEQETRTHELVDSSEPQDGSQAQADDLTDTTPDPQLDVARTAAKEPTKTVSAPRTKKSQSGTRRPFVVNIFQNIRILVSPKPPPRPQEPPPRPQEPPPRPQEPPPRPQEPGRIEEYTGQEVVFTLRRTPRVTVIGNQTDQVMSALRPLSVDQNKICLMYQYNGRLAVVYVNSGEIYQVHEADLYMKYVGPDTRGGPSNFDGCRNWRLMKVDDPLYGYGCLEWWDAAKKMDASLGAPCDTTVNTFYHTANKMGKLTPLKWRQPTTDSTEGIRAMVMQAVGLLLDSYDET